MKLTYGQVSTIVGAVLAVGVAVSDATLMHVLGNEVDKGLIYLAVGALLGTGVPMVKATP